jgi:hypothetical protein
MYATEQQAAILRAAVAEIKKHPETFDMGVWAEKDEKTCGTACCLAGQIVWNASTPEEWTDLVEAEQVGLGYPIRDRAAELLGLPGLFDADRYARPLAQLFHVHEWPKQLLPKVQCHCDKPDGTCWCDPPLPTPNQLETRVNHWIETGE